MIELTAIKTNLVSIPPHAWSKQCFAFKQFVYNTSVGGGIKNTGPVTADHEVYPHLVIVAIYLADVIKERWRR